MTTALRTETHAILNNLGVDADLLCGGSRKVRSPVTGEAIAEVHETSAAEVAQQIALADKAFRHWRLVPAPRRGEFVRQIGEGLRMHRQALGRLVSIEVGKAISEGLGEVQEM